MLNRFERLKYLYTIQICQFITVLFMVNRIDRLKHPHPMQISRFTPV